MKQLLMLLLLITPTVAQMFQSGTPQAVPNLDRGGAGIPTMNCVVGQRFFRTDAIAGQNIYGCTATNVWTLETVGAAISSLQLTDFTPSFTSSILTVQPGRVKFQNSPCTALTSVMTATIASGSGGPGVGKLYISDGCAVVLEYPNSLTLSISGSGIFPQAVATPGVSDTGFYLADVTINAGAFTAVVDKRSVLSSTALSSGTGIGITCTTGVCLIEIDGATVPTLGGTNIFTGGNDFSSASSFTPKYIAVNSQTGTTYAILTGDRNTLVTLYNTNPIALSIAQAGSTGFPSGWRVVVMNKTGSATATITPATSTIRGAATLSLAAGQWAEITSDGANYQAAMGGDLIGNVTSSGLSTTVATVGSSTAANIHAAELLANAATDANTPSTIVKRDGSGNFSAGTITAALTGAASGNVPKVATRNVTGTTDALVTGDRSGLVTYTNANPIAVSIAQAGSTGFPDGWEATVLNGGAGTATITPATSTIEGAATLVLTTGQAAKIWSNGTNYRATRQGKVASATSADSAAGLSATLAEAYFPALDGDVTTSAGDLTTAVASKFRTQTKCVDFSADNAASDLVDADLGPQGNLFKLPVASTIIEAAVSANAGTPKMPIMQKNHWGGSSWSATDITSAALSAGTAGIETCAATGTACLSGVAKDGTVTIVTAGSANILAAGDYIQTKTGSGFASSGAKRLTVCVTYTLN
jgi:hypothetical protein